MTTTGNTIFGDCDKLASVHLSTALTYLGMGAFANCDSLTSILIPASLVDSGYSIYKERNGCFRDCDNLKTVTFQEGTTLVAPRLLANCPGIESITIPDTVTKVAEEAFYNADGLKSINLSISTTEIGYDAFYDCDALISVVIPDSVVVMGNGVFDECDELASVTLSNRISTMGFGVFGNCDKLTSIHIPASLSDTGYSIYKERNGCFRDCDSLKTVTFGEGTDSIVPRLFANCPGLESIAIPETVIEIEEEAFYNADGLKSIVIPEKVESLGYDAFFGCDSLESVTIPESMTTIASTVFKDCTALKAVKVPESVTSFGDSVFMGCTALESAELPSHWKTLSKQTFRDCAALKTVVLPTALETIKENAFYGCLALPAIELPEGLTKIESEVFRNCDALTAITLPNSVRTLGNAVFYDCDALKDVALGSGVTVIPSEAFRHCDSLEAISWPYRIAEVKASAFVECTKLVSVTIPRATTIIDATTFSYPEIMTIYGVAGTYAETFAGEQNIKFVAIDVPATSVTLSATELKLAKGASSMLVATIEPANFTDEVSWKSSNESVVTIADDGTVKAVGIGEATIKLVVGSVSASCKVTVVQPVTSIALNKTKLEIEDLQTFQLVATVKPSNAENPAIEWTSSDESVATVDETGLVTAVSKGTATVTVSALDGSGVKNTCKVTVTNNAYIAATVEEMQSPHNYETSCSDYWQYTLEGAESIDVTFDERTCMEDGFDYLYVYDGNGELVGKFTGDELAGQTLTIPGDTVKIVMASDASGTEWGFAVTRIEPTSGEDPEPPAPATFAVVLSASPADGGVVSGAGTYDEGDEVTVVAVANDGYEFVKWTENGVQVSTNATYAFMASMDRELVAVFEAVQPEPEPEPETYVVSVSASPADGGFVTGGGTYDEGASVTVAAVANDGYKFVKWTENGVQVSTRAAYTFTASANRTLVAVFEAVAPEPEPDPQPSDLWKGFPDVKREVERSGGVSKVWYVSDGWLDYVVNAGLMSGYASTGYFGPYDNITRGQVAVILYRAECAKDPSLIEKYGSTTDPAKYAWMAAFRDEETSVYYTAAINWAKDAGIMTGDAGTNYTTVRPNDPVARQELCLMLARYANGGVVPSVELDPAKAEGILGMDKIASWARDGVYWAVNNGVIGGVNNGDGTFSMDPTGKTWRSAAAKMFTVVMRDIL